MYRDMWMMVMFDLPVRTSKERKHATAFRHALLDNGFSMEQFSVYIRYIGAREKRHAYINNIKAAAPAQGVVSILFFTDKQFRQTHHIYGNEYTPSFKNDKGQLLLF